MSSTVSLEPFQFSFPLLISDPIEFVQTEDLFSDVRASLKSVQNLDFDKLIASVSIYSFLSLP